MCESYLIFVTNTMDVDEAKSETKMKEAEEMSPHWSKRKSRSTGASYYLFHDPKTGHTMSQFCPPPHTTQVSSHYDGVTLSSSSKDRDSSDVSALRTFHNQVKGRMADDAVKRIQNAFTKDVKLRIVDLAAGKGSGLHKWHGVQVQKYFATDISPQACLEMQRRWKNMKRRAQTGSAMASCSLTTICADLKGNNPSPFVFKPGQRAHIVTLHFALNYFAETPRTMDDLMRKVSDMLEPGGIFMVTFMNWDTLESYFKKYGERGDGDTTVLRTPIFTLVRESGRKQYTVQLNTCLAGCPEFGVRPGIDVECRAAAHCLRLVKFVKMLSMYDPYRKAGMSSEEELFSSLNCSMMFQKQSK